MSNFDLTQTIYEKILSFNAKCEKEYLNIAQKAEKRRKKAEDREKHRQYLIKNFDETILKDLQNLFREIEPAFSSPYLEIVFDTHHQRKEFYIQDTESIPAYAFLALDAKSKADDETFDCTRYLLFVASASGDSFELLLKNESRNLLCYEQNEDDETALVQSYSFDSYDFAEIREHIEKYLIGELSYLQKNFKVRVEEWDD